MDPAPEALRALAQLTGRRLLLLATSAYFDLATGNRSSSSVRNLRSRPGQTTGTRPSSAQPQRHRVHSQHLRRRLESQ